MEYGDVVSVSGVDFAAGDGDGVQDGQYRRE
jgi:hypothetical protein